MGLIARFRFQIDKSFLYATVLACRGGRNRRNRAAKTLRKWIREIFDNLNVVRVACCAAGSKGVSTRAQSPRFKVGLTKNGESNRVLDERCCG